MDYNQNVVFAFDLPPIDPFASANATFRKWISVTNITASVREPWDEDKREFDPVSITETLTFTQNVNFQQRIVFDPEKNEYTTLTSRLNLWGFSAAYEMSYARHWSFNPAFTVGIPGQPLWEQSQEESFEPLRFTLGYTRTFAREQSRESRLAFSVNVDTNMNFDLQRHTNSNLRFSMGVNMRIVNFMVFSVSALSENAMMYRYFQNMPFFDSPPTPLYDEVETNFFKDLLNSFRFDNPELRRQSGFKLRGISMSLLHHLGDWNARLTVTTTPILPEGATSYRFQNELSFLVQWVPLAEIRTQIDYNDERLRVK
jgi:hypothetical protein